MDVPREMDLAVLTPSRARGEHTGMDKKPNIVLSISKGGGGGKGVLNIRSPLGHCKKLYDFGGCSSFASVHNQLVLAPRWNLFVTATKQGAAC